MTFKSDLKNLQNIHASELLHKRLGAKLSVLPIHKRGFNISLITFRLAIIGLLLVLLSAPATGILFAAKGSQRGNPFFPLKKTLEEHHAPFFQNTPTPMMTPIPTLFEKRKLDNQKEKGKEMNEERKEKEKDVKGISEEKEHKNNNQDHKKQESDKEENEN